MNLYQTRLLGYQKHRSPYGQLVDQVSLNFVMLLIQLFRHIPGVELKLAAIDNGLAFPVKHPEVASRFRQFPYGWSTLVWAQKVTNFK